MKLSFRFPHDKQTMNVICSICHENVRVPVRFTCFPCQHEPGRPSCHSITRICLLCAREYLQLNKKRSERVHSRKCIMCPATVRCANLQAISSYEKDFFIMAHDTKNNYNCFYEKEGCGFQGTQNQLDHHVQTECPFRTISCRLCQLYYQAFQEEEHLSSCPERFCCFQCGEFIPYRQEREHYLGHDLQKCPYCYQWVSCSMLEEHGVTCPEYPHECIYCHKRTPKRQLYHHLVGHIDLFQKIITQNNYTNNELLAIIPSLLDECRKYSS